jgi:hypothetical protein
VSSAVDELIALAGVPQEARDARAPDASEWKDVEFRLGLELPDDYKQLIAAFGSSNFGDFIIVLNPFSNAEHRQLERRAHTLVGATLESRRSDPESIPFAVFPEQCGLFPWAVTDNGDTLFWLTEGPSAYWPMVVLESRGPGHERHKAGTCALLCAFLKAELSSPILLDPFKGKRPLDAHRAAQPSGR